MTRDTITCHMCGGAIDRHWQCFDHVRCQPGDVPPEAQAQARAMERRLWQRHDALLYLRTGVKVTRREG
jgi:hypothetical protein